MNITRSSFDVLISRKLRQQRGSHHPSFHASRRVVVCSGVVSYEEMLAMHFQKPGNIALGPKGVKVRVSTFDSEAMAPEARLRLRTHGHRERKIPFWLLERQEVWGSFFAQICSRCSSPWPSIRRGAPLRTDLLM
jgi:hypothetical protein